MAITYCGFADGTVMVTERKLYLLPHLKNKQGYYVCTGYSSLKQLVKDFKKMPAYYENCHNEKLAAIQALINFEKNYDTTMPLAYASKTNT